MSNQIIENGTTAVVIFGSGDKTLDIAMAADSVEGMLGLLGTFREQM